MKLINAVKNNDLELVKKLIKEGYPLNNKFDSDTALMIASRYGRVEIVKELIKAGASINVNGDHDDTALLYASYNGHTEVVKELIKAGATLTVKNNLDYTALDYYKEIWQSYEMQDLILTMHPHLYSFLEDKVGIHKDILLKLKIKQILNV